MNNHYMNILIIGAETQPIPPTKGGAVEHLVNYLLEENERNKFANLSLISPYNKDAEIKSKTYRNTDFYFIKNLNGVKSYIYKEIDLFSRKFFKISTGLLYIHKICKIIKNNHYDLIVIENRPSFGMHIREIYEGKMYLHLHNDYINRNTQQLNEIVETYDKIIAISSYIKNKVLETGYKNVEVVYNGIDLEHYSIDNKYNPNKKTILYVGRIVKEKGLIELLKAFSLIKNNSLELVIIGDYDQNAYKNKNFLQNYKKLIKKDNRIKTIGYIDNDNLVNYYSKAYIGIIPTIIEEALSLSAIEMIASGLPVIATNSGGLVEVIDETVGIVIDKNNLIENIKNSLEQIVSNPHKRNQLSSNCRKKTIQFSKNAYIKKMINNLLN